MLHLRRRGAALITLITLLLAAGAPSASAHSIGPAAGKSAPEFVWLGTTHMLLGWDHLLFVAAVLLQADSARRAAGLISLFALGHSTTLMIATLAGWRVNPVAVDVVVALSLVFASVVGLLDAGERRWFALTVACFGLIHGLGLATRLQDLHLPEDGEVARVLAFKIGVEIGQMTAIAAFVALAAAARKLPPRLRPTGRVLRIAQAGLVACGVLAAATLIVVGNPPETAQAWVTARFATAPSRSRAIPVTPRSSSPNPTGPPPSPGSATSSATDSSSSRAPPNSARPPTAVLVTAVGPVSPASPENTASLALHQRAGFGVIGTRERIGHHHGVWRDVLLVERLSPLVS